MTKSPSDPFLGKRIREYEILELIGQGRLGAVYRARHVLLEQERAVKIVEAGIAGNSDLADRFIREARVLARMRHPNLVELYEFGKLEEGAFFMIMELLRGDSVRKRIDTLGKIAVLDAIHITREAASGLHLAHSMGVLHRDVSPDNLFLVNAGGSEEVTKVIDFAIAKPTAQEARTMQSTPVVMGRPEFWSPEQFGVSGHEVALDQRTDVYSLGVTLYNMVSGKLPFVSMFPKGTPEPFSAGDVPPKLERVIRKALSIEREERQESMMELISELDEVTFQEVRPTIQMTQQPPVPARFQPGYVFAGRYEIQKKIGKGGMGTVFKALDKILDIPVALKTMNPEISSDEKTLARLKREVILARKVAHPNVCRLYDIGESDGIHYVSMEFVDGLTLSDMLLVQGKLPPAEGLRILRQVLLALQEAHRAGVIHRDLKPQNIMVDVNQRAFIMDFGISYSADVDRLTTTGMMIGTPRYMAPEQFGESPLDLRADIYSMGIIFYEAFTGRLPFDAKTPATVMYAHIHSVPTPPAQLEPGIPPKLEQLILKALEKDPKKRFQNAAEMIAAIDSVTLVQTPVAAPATVVPQKATPKPVYQPPAPVAVEPESTRERMPPEPRSMVMPIVAVFIALIAAGSAAWYYFIRTPETAPAASTAQGLDGAKPPVASEPRQPQVKTPEPQQPAQHPAQQAEPPPQQQPSNEPAHQVPAVTERKIQVDSSPSGAAIILDGRETSTHTPAFVTVTSTQSIQMELRLTGYEPVRQTIDSNTPETLALTLTAQAPAQPTAPAEPGPAPAGAGKITYQGEFPVSIYNGRKLVLNTATAESAELPAGTYKLTLIGTATAIIRDNVKIEVKAGETVVIPAPAMSRISLNATPGNCKIFIDMNFVDVAPIFDLPIQAGNHHVRAQWETLGKEKSGFFTIAPNQTVTLRAIADETNVEIFQETSH